METNALDYIHTTVLYNGKRFELESLPHQYSNLMVWISDSICLDDFGQCKGMGRCGTCHVRLLDYSGVLDNRHRNEETALGNIVTSGRGDRLSCQILVDKLIDEVELEIVNE